MTSNIETIRNAEAQIPQLRDQLRALQAEARANDGVVDDEEQAEINQVESLINTTQQLITEKLRTWGANKTAYEKLRTKLATDLGKVEANEDAAFGQDKRAISVAVSKVDQAASVEDYATALSRTQELERLVDLFLKQVENERLNGLTTEELMEISLADENIDEVFTEEYMEALMTIPLKGEGTPELRDVIKKIEKGLSGANRTEVLTELAEIVGEPPTVADLDADYARFLILCKQRDAIGKEGEKGDIDPVDEKLHPDFVGSREQLMFGKVLGDALGIHEVFATLLSPTGGLVGPGNMLIGSVASPHLSPDNPVALHGTVHDAAGYLDSFHDEGPGYNYRGSEIEAMVTSAIELLPQSWENEILPFTGQLSGIGYWIVEAGDEYIEARFDEGLVALEQALESARDGASDQIDEIVSAIEDAKQELSDKADALRSDMEDAAAEAAQDLQDLVDEAQAEMLEASDALEDGFEKVSETVVETIENVSDAVGSFGEGVGEKLDAIANFIWN
ncbi:MAG: hypothetical protein GQ535_00345 [Rhodobacteraceae bacterium]|nr:hypothetical protein [Paracoccaceae bacterium]